MKEWIAPLCFSRRANRKKKYDLPRLEIVKISDVKRAKELGIAYFQSFEPLSLSPRLP